MGYYHHELLFDRLDRMAAGEASSTDGRFDFVITAGEDRLHIPPGISSLTPTAAAEIAAAADSEPRGLVTLGNQMYQYLHIHQPDGDRIVGFIQGPEYLRLVESLEHSGGNSFMGLSGRAAFCTAALIDVELQAY